jgi:uncharacterized protein HemX
MTKITSMNNECNSAEYLKAGPATQGLAPKTISTAGAALLLLSAASLIASILVFVACVYVWQSVSEIHTIEARLDRLNDFERRIVGRFDQSDAAIQALIQETNTRIVNIRSSIDNTDAKRKDAIHALEEMAVQLRMVAGGMPSSAGVIRPTPKTISLQEPLSGSDKKPVSAKVSTTEFQRVESADGSVTYQTIR